MKYAVLQTEPQLWSVGYYDGSNIFHPVSDHGSFLEAQEAVNRANGIRTPKMIQEDRLERFTLAAMEGFLASWDGSDNNPGPSTVAKKSLEYALATLAALDQELKKSL